MRLEHLDDTKVFCLRCGEIRKKGATRYCSKCKVIKHFMCPYACEGTFSVAMYARHMKHYHPQVIRSCRRSSKYIPTLGQTPKTTLQLTKEDIAQVPTSNLQVSLKVRSEEKVDEFIVKPFGQPSFNECPDGEKPKVLVQLEVLANSLGFSKPMVPVQNQGVIENQGIKETQRENNRLPSIREIFSM